MIFIIIYKKKCIFAKILSMGKRISIFLIGLLFSVVCSAQEGAPTPQDFYKYPNFAPGAGFEIDFSNNCTNFSIPIELRLFSVENQFNFALGERINLRKTNKDENQVQNFDYYCALRTPYINYEQYSTYVNARWNIVRFCDTNFVGIFVGAGYYFNINTAGKIFIDAPTQGPWLDDRNLPDHYMWQEGAGWQAYRCESLLHRISHSARLELGFTTPGIEISLYAMLALTNPVNLATADQTLYYDRYHRNDQLSTHPVTIAGGDETHEYSSYLPVRLADYAVLYNGLYDRVSVGFSLKAHLFTGYWTKLFKKKH